MQSTLKLIHSMFRLILSLSKLNYLTKYTVSFEVQTMKTFNFFDCRFFSKIFFNKCDCCSGSLCVYWQDLNFWSRSYILKSDVHVSVAVVYSDECCRSRGYGAGRVAALQRDHCSTPISLCRKPNVGSALRHPRGAPLHLGNEEDIAISVMRYSFAHEKVEIVTCAC